MPSSRELTLGEFIKATEHLDADTVIKIAVFEGLEHEVRVDQPPVQARGLAAVDVEGVGYTPGGEYILVCLTEFGLTHLLADVTAESRNDDGGDALIPDWAE